MEYFTTTKYEVVVVSRHCKTELQMSATKWKRVRDMQSLSFSVERYKTRSVVITWYKSVKWVDKKLIILSLKHWQFTSDLSYDLITWEKRHFILYPLGTKILQSIAKSIFNYLFFSYLKKRSLDCILYSDIVHNVEL